MDRGENQFESSEKNSSSSESIKVSQTLSNEGWEPGKRQKPQNKQVDQNQSINDAFQLESVGKSPEKVFKLPKGRNSLEPLDRLQDGNGRSEESSGRSSYRPPLNLKALGEAEEKEPKESYKELIKRFTDSKQLKTPKEPEEQKIPKEQEESKEPRDKKQNKPEKPEVKENREETEIDNAHMAAFALSENWDLLDTNKDGEIDKSELAARTKKYDPNRDDYAFLQKNFESITSLSHDGILANDPAISKKDLNYFADLSRESRLDLNYHERGMTFLKENFKELDSDGDKTISVRELEKARLSGKYKADPKLIFYLQNRIVGDYASLDDNLGHSYDSSNAKTVRYSAENIDMSLNSRLEETQKAIYGQNHSSIYSMVGKSVGLGLGSLAGTYIVGQLAPISPIIGKGVYGATIGAGIFVGRMVGKYVDYRSGTNYYENHQRNNLNKMFRLNNQT